jgi:hypothetical protein
VSLVYKKALKLTNAARQQATVGEIVNLEAIDAQKFFGTSMHFHMVLSLFFTPSSPLLHPFFTSSSPLLLFTSSLLFTSPLLFFYKMLTLKQFWSGPLQILVCVYLLWRVLGAAAIGMFLTRLFYLILIIVVNVMLILILFVFLYLCYILLLINI